MPSDGAANFRVTKPAESAEFCFLVAMSRFPCQQLERSTGKRNREKGAIEKKKKIAPHRHPTDLELFTKRNNFDTCFAPHDGEEFGWSCTRLLSGFLKNGRGTRTHASKTRTAPLDTVKPLHDFETQTLCVLLGRGKDDPNTGHTHAGNTNAQTEGACRGGVCRFLRCRSQALPYQVARMWTLSSL